MANNILITQGSGTTLATTDVGGVHHQKIRVSWGKNGKETSDIKFAPINATLSGDNTLVALVASTIIRLVSITLSASGQVNAKFKSGAGTDISGLLYFDTRGGLVNPEASRGLLQTAAGEALVLNLSSAVTVGGFLSYVEEA